MPWSVFCSCVQSQSLIYQFSVKWVRVRIWMRNSRGRLLCTTVSLEIMSSLFLTLLPFCGVQKRGERRFWRNFALILIWERIHILVGINFVTPLMTLSFPLTRANTRSDQHQISRFWVDLLFVKISPMQKLCTVMIHKPIIKLVQSLGLIQIVRKVIVLFQILLTSTTTARV